MKLNKVRKFYSWSLGLRIGQICWTKASPFIIGSFENFLPFNNQGIKYRIWESRWDGFKWTKPILLEMTKEELKKYHFKITNG